MVQKKIKNHLSDRELNSLIREKKKDCKMFKKLSLIKSVKNGTKIADACEFLSISEPTGHNWVDNYNEYGFEGLKTHYERSGRPSKLTDEQKEELDKILENEDYLTPERAMKIIKSRYGVEYSKVSIKRIVRKLGYNFGKPHQKFHKRPKNAEECLKKT
jgi:putative transposase